MRALQLHYTSCRRGQAAGAGFQTRALTPGILPEELREIERRGLYRPPRDAPQEPTAEEIEADFPRALRFYTLESGRRALTRAGYAGQDYSGRWGNYFAHTLVFEGDAPPIWPVDFYEWEGWVDRLAPADDTEAEPAPLPAVDLAEIAPGESFTLEDLQAFLREEPGREQVLERMARAVLLYAESGRPVVVRDTAVNGLYWLACVQKLFPPAHAAHLSFSSYQYDARGAALLNATTGATDFTFSDTERHYQFQLFDPAAGVHGDVPADADDYPARAARWLAEDPDALDAFIEFTALFGHVRPDGELAHAARLFHYSRGGEGSLAGAQLSGILEFVREHTHPEARGQVLGMVLRAARQAREDEWAPEDHGRLVAFLAAEARASGEPGHRALALSAWRSLLERRVMAGGGGTGVAAEGWRQVRAAYEEAPGELEEGVLDPALWEHALPRLHALPAEVSGLLLWVVAAVLAPRRDPWPQPARAVVSALLEALAEAAGDTSRATRLALEALRRGGLGPVALADACRELAEAVSARAGNASTHAAAGPVGAGMGEVLVSMPAEEAACVRAALDDEGGWAILYGEWVRIVAGSHDPAADFQRYRAEVLDRLPGYGCARRGAVMASLMDALPDGRAGRMALEWARDGVLATLPPERRADAVARAAAALPMDDWSAAALRTARRVATAACDTGVAVRPDRPRLLEALSAARTRGEGQPAPRLDEVSRALGGIDEGTYSRFLGGFLPAALDHASNRREHQRVLDAVYLAEHHDAFLERYRAWFREPAAGRPAAPFQAAARHWLMFDADAVSRLAPLARMADEECIRALAELEPQALGRLGGGLRLQGEGAARWERWEAEALERRRGLVGRLGRWGRGLFGR